PLQEGQRLAAVARGGEQPPGLRDVEVEVEAVAVLAGLQPGSRRAEACAQPGDVGVQGLSGGVRRLGGPQRVHEVVDGDGAALGQREQREHGPALGPRHLDGGTVDDQAQRPEHLHPRVRFAHFLPLPCAGCRRGDSARQRRATARPQACPVSTTEGATTMDHDKVMEFLGQMVNDLGAAGSAGGVAIGYRLGLYRALSEGPATAEAFADRTDCHPRYTTEWLRGQAAAGYVTYSAASGEFS